MIALDSRSSIDVEDKLRGNDEDSGLPDLMFLFNNIKIDLLTRFM